MDEEKLIQLIEKAKTDKRLYSPVVVDDKIYFQFGGRKLDDNIKKMQLFPDLKGESVVDVGSNSGFNIFYLKEHKGAGMCLGLDNDSNLISLSNFLNKEYSYTDVAFSHFDINKKQFIDELPPFENYLFLSISSARGNIFIDDFYNTILELVKKARKRVFVEPTNHEKFNPKEYYDFYMDYFKEFGEVKYLGNTIYQNRGLFQITKNL